MDLILNNTAVRLGEYFPKRLENPPDFEPLVFPGLIVPKNRPPGKIGGIGGGGGGGVIPPPVNPVKPLVKPLAPVAVL